jgi:hypothetical protein
MVRSRGRAPPLQPSLSSPHHLSPVFLLRSERQKGNSLSSAKHTSALFRQNRTVSSHFALIDAGARNPFSACEEFFEDESRGRWFYSSSSPKHSPSDWVFCRKSLDRSPAKFRQNACPVCLVVHLDLIFKSAVIGATAATFT